MAFAWQQRATVSRGGRPRVATLRQDFKLGAPSHPPGEAPWMPSPGAGGAVDRGRAWKRQERSTAKGKAPERACQLSSEAPHNAGLGWPGCYIIPRA